MGALSLTKNSDLRTSIYNSLNINYGSFFQYPTFGSKLYQIKKITDANLLLAKQYVQEALTWIIQVGRATSIDVLVEKDLQDRNRFDIKVTATQPSGLIITYKQFKLVGN